MNPPARLPLFEACDDYPRSPGWRKTDTSRDAARSIAPKAQKLRDIVYRAIEARGEQGATCHELADITGIEYASAQPRFTELRIAGKIEDSGQRRKTPSGKASIVWVAV